MDKSMEQIVREVDTMLEHEAFSERLILVLLAVSVFASLAGWSRIWCFLWFLPMIGYCVGRHVHEDLHYPARDYWLFSLGSQLALAFMVGVPLLIRYGL